MDGQNQETVERSENRNAGADVERNVPDFDSIS